MILHSRSAQGPAQPAVQAEGSYLASASDLMIGLLFVFIILVVVLALEQRRQAIDHAGRQDPRGMVTNRIGDAMKIAMPNVRIDPASGVISLPEEVLFTIGRADLSDKGRQALRAAVEQLGKVLPCFVANWKATAGCEGNAAGHEIDTIFIEGHTDSRPLQTPGYDNTNLSLDRARAVHAALVNGSALAGYRNRLAQPLFSFSAYADTRLLPDVAPTDAKNRRVDLRIVLTYRPTEEWAGKLLPAQGKR